MEMRKKTIAMTMVDGKVVDNYEKQEAIAAKVVDLMGDAIVVYNLNRSNSPTTITKKMPYKCPLTGIIHWVPTTFYDEVGDVAYFKNKMLANIAIPKEVTPEHRVPVKCRLTGITHWVVAAKTIDPNVKITDRDLAN